MRFVNARPGLFDAGVTIALSSVLTLALLWPSRRSLASPIGGADALAHYATGFMGRTSTHFGYPFGMTPFPYFPNTDLTQRALATAFQSITGERILSVNLVWILSFPLTALAAWWVLRLAGAARLLASTLAVSFTFVPYHIFRGMDHIYLAAMWSVPLAVGLAVLVGRGQIPGLVSSGWQGKAAVVALSLVVAWSGIYYSFFACLLMITALGWLIAQGGSRRALALSAVPLALVIGAMVTVLFSAALAQSSDPPTSMVASRQPSESALYSGNLAFALTPSPLTDLPFVGNRASRFDAYVQPELEGYGYGQFGTVVSSVSALILVMGLGALSRRRRIIGPHVTSATPHGLHLALLATSLVFFVPWSLNFSFALLVTPEIRAWDRLLPFILLLLMIGAVSVSRDLVSHAQRGWQVATAVVIVGCTIFEAITPYSGMLASRFQEGDQQVRSAAAYAARVNAAVPMRCGVLQLPYVPFPEKATRLADMADYEHFLVSLTNFRKLWSYGGVKYTTASRWAAALSDDLTQPSVVSLVVGGFCGVHLDHSGYPSDEAAAVSASLERLLGPAAAEGMDGHWQFFELPTDGTAKHDVRERGTLTPAAERLFYPTTDGG